MASGFAFWGAFFFFLISRTQISWKHCQWDPVTHIYVHEKLKKTDKVLKGRKSSFFPTACGWDTTCKSLQRFGPHLFLIPALCSSVGGRPVPTGVLTMPCLSVFRPLSDIVGGDTMAMCLALVHGQHRRPRGETSCSGLRGNGELFPSFFRFGWC